MRIQKAVFVAGIIFVIGLFITEVGNAADMSRWVGKWFSYKVSIKGIEMNQMDQSLAKAAARNRDSSKSRKVTGIVARLILIG